ncbi:spore germination protein GerPC [Paenibacillus sp. J22TS3]|uniref:spore germination protein GerPC n=1 Tax=Paenibacillus sp. J22TS3 TaxID=2807192 RepID=UPI001B1E1E6A|nr:spore germination protein GerPC [Paenibacillus sp. J22TS3]GIP19862.1 putative spore germination protein GerPC [Paenibacillus sp. J22TS3]
MHPYYFQQIINQLQSIAAKLDQLEETIKGMSQTIEGMKSRESASADRVQYHFDLLKIEKLEGTLNIGTAPGNGQSIDQIAVGDQPAASPEAKDSEVADINQKIKAQVLKYIDEEVPGLFDYMLSVHQLTLSDEYKKQVYDDIRRQISDRIAIYAKQVNALPDITDTNQKINMVTAQLKRDIQTALNYHIEQTLLGK